MSNSRQTMCIERGYFILTMMPSLKCSLNCPHCYLSKEQRRNPEILSHDNLAIICRKLAEYFNNLDTQITIICYWYGGEPMEMGLPYTREAVNIINHEFSGIRELTIRHTFLSSLINLEHEWIDFFREAGNNYVQTSFDGEMRGKGYIRRWEKNVRVLKGAGLDVGTISVVNRSLMKVGPKEIINYLADLGIRESSFLPFMLNVQNSDTMYELFAPTMRQYSEFMIELTDEYMSMINKGMKAPDIGQMRFILEQTKSDNLSNVAGQTLFLMPNGDVTLPDYYDGYKEELNTFGNLLKQDVVDVLSSPSRVQYLRKQMTRNYNSECLECDYSDSCIMEFWKPNRSGDDCFGASQYVRWVKERMDSLDVKNSNILMS